MGAPMTGWIAVDRGIFDHEFFTRGPMTECEAWIWIISHAAWKTTRQKVGPDMVDVPRGSFLVTLKDMQIAWMWGSDTRVRNFLKRLESERMVITEIVVRKDARKTQVTICNYNEYQTSERGENVGENAGSTKPETHKRNNEPVNQKKEAKASRATPSKANVFAILSQVASPDMAQKFIKFRADMKKPITDDMAGAMLEILNGHHDPDAVLNNSIANGWQGIFPDKIKRTDQQNGKPTGQGRLSAFIAGASGAPRVDSWEDSNPSLPLLARR